MYGKCIPTTLNDFASECVHYNVNIISRGKELIFIKKWVDCCIVSIGQLQGPNRYLTYNEFKTKFQAVSVNTICYTRAYWLQLRITKRNWV